MALLTPRQTALALFAGTLFLAAPQIGAHHSSAPHFDRSKTVEFTGKVTELKFVNPHAYLYIDVMENGASVNWRCELSAATLLRRRGWSADMFDGGETVTIQGSPAWREDNVCVLSTISIEGDSEITRNTVLGESTAQDNEYADAPRAKYLPNGQLNISGAWLTKSFGRDSLGTQPEFIPNEAGKKAMLGYDMRFDDPVLRCHFVSIFKGWSHDSSVNKVEQSDDAVTLTYGFMDAVRTIHLDQDSHPKDLKPSMTGHSIGRWEDDVLIVDTIGFEAGVLDHSIGVKHSEDMQAQERFYIDAETQYLVREYTASDPLLAQPAYGMEYHAQSPEAYEPYGCTELAGANNILPEGVDPDSLPGPKISPMGGGPQSAMAGPQNASAPGGASSGVAGADNEGLAWPVWLTIALAIAVLLGMGGFIKSRKGG